MKSTATQPSISLFHIGSKKAIVTGILFLFVSVSFAQKTQRFEKKLWQFCTAIKEDTTSFKVDTTTKFGIYQALVEKYFDTDSLETNFKQETEKFSDKAKYQLLQYTLNSLKTQLKYLPKENLSAIQAAYSKGLAPNWNKPSANKEDIKDMNSIKNSLLLVFKQKGKVIELFSIAFNRKNGKIISIIPTHLDAAEMRIINLYLPGK